MDGTCVNEDIFAFFEAKISIALKVSLSLGNQGRVEEYIPYFIVSVDIFDHGRLLAIWKKIEIIFDFGENGSEMFKWDM